MAMGNSWKKEEHEEIKCCFKHFQVGGKLYVDENDATSEWQGYKDIGNINTCVRKYMDRPSEPLSDEYIIANNKQFATSRCFLCNSDTEGYVSGGQGFNSRIEIFKGSPYTRSEVVNMIKNGNCIKHIGSYIFKPKADTKDACYGLGKELPKYIKKEIKEDIDLPF